jgi:hypothetical protein
VKPWGYADEDERAGRSSFSAAAEARATPPHTQGEAVASARDARNNAGAAAASRWRTQIADPPSLPYLPPCEATRGCHEGGT